MNAKYIRYMLLQCFFALLIFLTLIFFLMRYEESRYEYQLTNTSQTLAYTIQQNINTSKGVLISLAYNYEIDPNLGKDKFNLLSEYYIRHNPDIIYIQHKDNLTVTDMVYPSDYDYTLGASLTGRKEVEEAVNKAIQGKIITANAPFILKDTEDLLGLIIRYPLYQNDEFRGFFVVAMNVNDFMDSILSEQLLQDYHVNFYDNQGNLFWGTGEVSSRFSHSIDIPILDNTWTMKLALRHSAISSTSIFAVISSLLFFLIIGLLVYMQMGFFRKDKNIRHLANLKAELEKVKESFSLALDSANDALWEWNIKTGEIFTSDKWVDITGYTIIGQGVDAILHKNAIHPEDYPSAAANLEACLLGAQSSFASEYRIRSASGHYRWLLNKGQVYLNEHGKPSKMAGSITTIDERKQRESKIENLAYYDSLTGLPNKARFMEVLEQELKISAGNHHPCSILMLDLDNFKIHNDSLGLDFCDKLLKQIGEKISIFAGKNNLTARFGGDEFLVLMKDIHTKEQAEAICQNILDIFLRPFLLDLKSIHLTASIGLVYCVDTRHSVSEILRNVDTALNKAKDSGKNRYCLFDMNMHEEILRKSKVEACLRDALIKDSLLIHYQLQQNLSDDKIRGVEALARLQNEELGIVSPGEFIGIAEYTGLIVPLGNRVLKTACMQGKEWLDAGYAIGKLSVNISPYQLFRHDFYQEVKEILAQTNFPVDRLELEITESMFFNSADGNMELLRRLKSLGLSISLDDFGTGYSSLNYLTVLPIDTLKIDKSFIDKAFERELESQVIRAIIDLAHNLHLHVVAEGVESLDQKKILKLLHCDSIQGYYFAKPMNATEVEKILGEFR